jgi:O-acetyl-ADP-ribose deacetylase (regulator of RNase III)
MSMFVCKADLWKIHEMGATIVVPTNGSVTREGLAVMGRGLALQASQRFSDLRRELAQRLHERGNRVYHFPEYRIICFPVKHEWSQQADLDLIRQSAKELRERASKLYIQTVWMPMVGTGNGGRTWREVEPIIEEYLSGCAIVTDTRAEEPQKAAGVPAQ